MLASYANTCQYLYEFEYNGMVVIHRRTFVIPGRSTSVRLTTLVEYIFRLMASGQMPLLLPAMRSVSRSISWRICSKSEYILSFVCRNFPHSSKFTVPKNITHPRTFRYNKKTKQNDVSGHGLGISKVFETTLV